jgi:hypothetical protein
MMVSGKVGGRIQLSNDLSIVRCEFTVRGTGYSTLKCDKQVPDPTGYPGLGSLGHAQLPHQAHVIPLCPSIGDAAAIFQQVRKWCCTVETVEPYMVIPVSFCALLGITLLDG